MHGLKMLGSGPAIASLALGKTSFPLYSNIVRAVFFPLAVWVAVTTGSLELLLLVGIAAELTALLVLLYLVCAKLGKSPRLLAGWTLVFVTATVGMLLARELPAFSGMLSQLLLGGFVFVGAMLVLAGSYRESRQWLAKIVAAGSATKTVNT
ncbi:hypothetical protein CAI21_09765 [Alkalilimnicola ehrlichii]|nr:hypothetical protein CAI21_09765 [Alkalilimnicola ehrlichii]